MRRSLRLAFAIILAAAACHANTGANAEDDSDVVTLSIVNHNRLDVVIYNVADGHRDRLGDVTAATTRNFTLHMNRFPAGEIQLYADPIGQLTGQRSESVRPLPGQTVEWTLESDLQRSFISIKNGD
jgi:hypothetical protein